MRKTVSGALLVLKMFKTALHGEKVVHIYWHTSAFSLRLRLSHAMHAITSIRILHGVAVNSKKYCPMWRHCRPRVKTETSAIARGEAEGNSTCGGLHPRATVTLQRAIFFAVDRNPMQYSFYYMANSRNLYLVLIHPVIKNIQTQISWYNWMYWIYNHSHVTCLRHTLSCFTC